jgi:hypothetical protein
LALSAAVLPLWKGRHWSQAQHVDARIRQLMEMKKKSLASLRAVLHTDIAPGNNGCRAFTNYADILARP